MRIAEMHRSASWRTGAVFVVLATACTVGNGSGAEATLQTGGTLRVAMVVDATANLDPQKEYSPVGFELFRCCLLRTLMATNGLPTDHGGSVLHPDLASELPDISTDGLTWTFHLKQGLHYAPPLQDTEITAPDLIRALEREATPLTSSNLTYAFYYSVIAGFDDFASGKAQRIVGLSAPDSYTLVVELNQPAGDLGYRFSLPATAPIPPDPTDPSANFGAAEGHDNDYGRFLIASGPYMFTGSDKLDLTVPVEEQVAVAGYEPGVSIGLVRNPSWVRSTDPLRPALPDRIDVTIALPAVSVSVVKASDRLMRAVIEGRSDLLFDAAPSAAQLDRLGTDARLAGLVHSEPANGAIYLSMNLAVPPFDDIHVRRALNFVIDREAVVRAFAEQGVQGQPALHDIPDSLEGGLLGSFAPYTSRANLERARREMAASSYGGPDGECHDPACRGLNLYPIAGGSEAPAEEIARDLHAIGIDVVVAACCSSAVGSGAPTEHTALTLRSWSGDFTDASTFFLPLFYGPGIVGSPTFTRNNYDVTLLGSAPSQLKGWGYSHRSVPSIDGSIEACLPQVGATRTACWAALDQRLTTEVVPIAPLLFTQTIRVVSPRVGTFAFDQFAAEPSLDRIGLAPQSSEAFP